MYDSDDEVLFIAETPPKRGLSADFELPAAKKPRTDHESSSSQLPDHSSDTAVGHGGAEVQLVAVNKSRHAKGKYPARATADEQQVKSESQPRQYDFADEDFFDLFGLTEQQLDEYAAGGPNGASSSRSLERRTQKVVAYRRFLAAQEGVQQPQQQLSASNNEGPIEIDLDIPDSQEEQDEPVAADDSDPQAAAAAQPAEQRTTVAEDSAAVPPAAAERPAVQQQRAPAPQHTQARQQQQSQQQPQQQRQRAVVDDMQAADDNTRQHQQQQQQQQRRPPRPRQPPQQQQQQPTPRPRSDTHQQQQQQQQQQRGQQGQQQQQGQQPYVSEEVIRRRKLRQHLENEIQRAQQQQDQLTHADSGKLLDLVTYADDLGEKTSMPREAVKHAEYLALLAGFGLQKLRTAQSQSSGRRPIDLVNALKFAYRANDEGLGPAEIDWKQIGRDAVSAGRWRTAVGVDNMLGPLHAETRVRRVAQRRPRQEVAAQVRPIENPPEESGLTQETAKWTKEMIGVLSAHPGENIPIIQLVVNHESFSQTVENIFALSFLVKEAWARIVFNADHGLQVVGMSEKQRHSALNEPRSTAAAAGGSSSSDGVRAKQFMMAIDMEMWRDMCRIVPRGQALMSHRASTLGRTAQQQQHDGQQQQQSLGQQQQQQQESREQHQQQRQRQR